LIRSNLPSWYKLVGIVCHLIDVLTLSVMILCLTTFNITVFSVANKTDNLNNDTEFVVLFLLSVAYAECRFLKCYNVNADCQ